MNEEEAKIEKMSEKICQLTRVVYLLNQKNIESQATIDSIISSYEEEINNIVIQANNATSFLRNKIKQLESPERIKAKFNEITEQLSSQFQCALATKIDELNVIFKSKQEAVQNEYNIKVKEMKAEVNEIKEELKLYKEKVSISQQNEYNKAIDDIKKESHKQIESIIISYEDMNKQKETVITDLTQKNKDLNIQIDQLSKNNTNINNQLITIEKEYKQQISGQQELLTQMFNDNALKDNAILSIENESKEKIKELTQQKDMLSKESEKYKKRSLELEIEVKDTKTQLLQIELQYERTQIDKEALDNKQNQFNQQIEQLEINIKESKELYSNELKVNKTLIKDNADLQIQLLSLEEKVKQTESTSKSQIDVLLQKIKELEEKWKKKILTINELKGNHQSEINQLKFSFQTTIDEMKRVKTASDTSSQEVQRLKQLFNEEKALMENKHREDIEKLSFKYAMTINELKNKHNEDMINIKQENVKMKDRLNNHEKEIKRKQEEFKLSQIDHFQKMKHDFMDALNIQQEKNYNLTNEINDLENYLANRPSREEDIEEIRKLRDELHSKEQELLEMKYFQQRFKNDLEVKEDININSSLTLQGKNLKKIKIVNSNINANSNVIVNNNKEVLSTGNGVKKGSSTLKNPKYTNATYGMIFSKK